MRLCSEHFGSSSGNAASEDPSTLGFEDVIHQLFVRPSQHSPIPVPTWSLLKTFLLFYKRDAEHISSEWA